MRVVLFLIAHASEGADAGGYGDHNNVIKTPRLAFASILNCLLATERLDTRKEM
jgi:hypothetical protein